MMKKGGSTDPEEIAKNMTSGSNGANLGTFGGVGAQQGLPAMNPNMGMMGMMGNQQPNMGGFGNMMNPLMFQNLNANNNNNQPNNQQTNSQGASGQQNPLQAQIERNFFQQCYASQLK